MCVRYKATDSPRLVPMMTGTLAPCPLWISFSGVSVKPVCAPSTVTALHKRRIFTPRQSNQVLTRRRANPKATSEQRQHRVALIRATASTWTDSSYSGQQFCQWEVCAGSQARQPASNKYSIEQNHAGPTRAGSQPIRRACFSL